MSIDPKLLVSNFPIIMGSLGLLIAGKTIMVAVDIMTPQLSSLLFLMVGILMALTPCLAAGGHFIASNFDHHDVRSLLPDESEIIAQLLSERLILFVALDVNRYEVIYFLHDLSI
ncbi:hypothetical protein Hanom_Chr10g00946441 [Helianthus anomalus]